MLDITNSKCLISHHWPRSTHRARIFSNDEKYITCSGEVGDNIISLPRGTDYDVCELVQTLGKQWQPEIFIAKVDAYFNLVPRNLQNLDCIKILILGDTQHGRQPLTRMLAYAQEENYDFYITDHKRHHLWFYHLAGIENLYWLPGLFLRPLEQQSENADGISATFSGNSVFIGQTGKFHPRRQRLIEKVKSELTNFWAGQLPQQQSLSAYQHADISLNISLNGDLNLRTFEIVSASGFLMTDRLSCESGLDLLLERGVDYESYSSIDELCEKLSFYSKNQQLIQQFKSNAYSKYVKYFSPDVLITQLNNIINGKVVEPTFCKDTVFRIKACRNLKYSRTRITLYEIVQELNLYLESVHLYFSGQCEFSTAIDFLDLPRTYIKLHHFSDSNEQGTATLIQRSGEQYRFKEVDSLREVHQGSLLFTDELSLETLAQVTQESCTIIGADFHKLEQVTGENPQYFKGVRIFILDMECYILTQVDNHINPIIEKSDSAEEIFLERRAFEPKEITPEQVNHIYALYQAGDIQSTANQITALINSGVAVKNYRVNFAHILLLAANWKYISALLPANTNFFQTSGWLRSVETGRPVNQLNQAIPWYTYPAIDFVETIIDRNWTVFEWGSGNSTLWWSQRVKKVISVENNKQWFEEVKGKLSDNVDFFLKENADYITLIDRYQANSFDVIIIDGSERNECTYHAISKLKEGGILIFDNSDCVKYKEAQLFLLEQEFFRIDFWGLIPSYAYKNCTSIYSKSTNFINAKPIPAEHNSSVGISCSQALDSSKIQYNNLEKY